MGRGRRSVADCVTCGQQRVREVSNLKTFGSNVFVQLAVRRHAIEAWRFQPSVAIRPQVGSAQTVHG